jgi:D-threo-aldose 1-dehydrogenase
MASTDRTAFGGAPIGGLFTAVGHEQALATVEAAWQRGVRTYDTAPHYGLGLGETRLGEVLRGKPRDEFVLSTKVGRLLEPDPAFTADPGGFEGTPHLRRRLDYSADGARRSLDESLARLGLDRVDVALVHDADDHEDEAVAGALPALVRLRDQGVVRAVGVGMNQWEMPLRLLDRIDLDVVLLAGRWTLLDRTGQPLLDACAERGVRVMVGGALNSGVLADPHDGATFDYVRASRDVIERAQRLQAICEAHGVPLVAAALQFPLRHPAVSHVLVGARSAAELHANLDHLASPVPAVLWAELGA